MWGKENLEQKLANRNFSFSLCTVPFYFICWKWGFFNIFYFCRKIWRIYRKIWRFRFSCKNGQIFFKKIIKSQEKFSTFSQKFLQFFKKICQFIWEKLTVFTGKWEDFGRKKNLMVFTRTFDDLDFP